MDVFIWKAKKYDFQFRKYDFFSGSMDLIGHGFDIVFPTSRIPNKGSYRNDHS